MSNEIKIDEEKFHRKCLRRRLRDRDSGKFLTRKQKINELDLRVEYLTAEVAVLKKVIAKSKPKTKSKK